MSLKINRVRTLSVNARGDVVIKLGSSASLVTRLARRRIDMKHGKNAFDRLQKIALMSNLREGEESSILVTEMARASTDINSVITDLMALQKPRLPAHLYDCVVRSKAADKFLSITHASSRLSA